MYKRLERAQDAGAHKGRRREVLRAGGIRSGSSKQKKATTLEREDLMVRSKREAIKEEHEGGG